jgi:hypothetical protein
MLTITRGGYEQAVREASLPATTDALPQVSCLNVDDQQRLADACARTGIDLVGARPG